MDRFFLSLETWRALTRQTSTSNGIPRAWRSAHWLWKDCWSPWLPRSDYFSRFHPQLFHWSPKVTVFLTFFLHHLQVTTLVNSSNKGPSNKKKGRSKKAHVLAASVETATQNFLEKGEKIAKESQFLKDELTAAVEDVRKQGMQKREVLTRVGLTV